jgi:CubicO group peptidase (beta-lactamase class C family)
MGATMKPLGRREALRLGGGVALATLGGCIPNGRVKRPLEMTPRDFGDWDLATPESVGLDPLSLLRGYERVFSEDEFLDTVALLVVCQGKLVAEGYVRDEADARRKEFIQSVTKSVVSMAFGADWPVGAFANLDAPVSHWLPVRDPAKSALTLRHLLTMRSGIDIDQDTFNIEVSMRRRSDVTDWILSAPMFAAPGATFRYADCNPQLLAAVVHAATGASVEDIARRRIFEPLRISDVDWEHTADGLPFGGYGLRLRARDLAKLGELVRRRGRWGAWPIVSEAWLRDATIKQSDTTHSANRHIDYGFQFWVVNDLEGFSTWGHGGNFTVVVPRRELVVTLTGMPNAGDDIAPQLWHAVDLVQTMLG